MYVTYIFGLNEISIYIYIIEHTGHIFFCFICLYRQNIKFINTVYRPVLIAVHPQSS